MPGPTAKQALEAGVRELLGDPDWVFDPRATPRALGLDSLQLSELAFLVETRLPAARRPAVRQALRDAAGPDVYLGCLAEAVGRALDGRWRPSASPGGPLF